MKSLLIRFIRWLIGISIPKDNLSDPEDIVISLDTVTVYPTKIEKTVSKLEQRVFPILSAGHGPTTAGKRSPKYKGWQFLEYRYNIDTVSIIAEKLNNLGWKYAIVNDYLEGCQGNCLQERVAAIKYMIDVPEGMFPIIIDQHANAYGDSWNNITGSEIWVADVDYRRPLRLAIASIFLENMVKRHSSRNRGIKMNKENRFTILYDTPYLAFILEPEFYTNLDKAKYLDTSGKELQAGAVVDSLKQINNIV